MYDIINPVASVAVEKIDPVRAEELVLAGIKTGYITDIHSAVEYANSVVEEVVNGSDIEGLFNRIVAELRLMNAKIDNAVRTNTDNPEDGKYFMVADILAFKIDQYGSVEAYKEAMELV